MSGRKLQLRDYIVLNAASLNGNSNGTPTNCQFMDNIGYQFNNTSGSVATYGVQVSVDYNQDINGNVTNAGNWVDLPLSPAIGATGSAGTAYVDINQTGAPWIRPTVTHVSGSGGTVTIHVTGKML